MHENEISGAVIDLCIKIHRNMGPGLLESVYEELLCHELNRQKISYVRQHAVPVIYEGVQMHLGFRADLVVENKVIVELKSVDVLAPVHSKILLTYLRLSGLKLGLLINFKVSLLKDGITRLVNGL